MRSSTPLFLPFAAVAALTMLAAPIAAGQEPVPFTLVISTAKTTYRSGQEVQLKVVLTNTSKATQRVPPSISRSDRGESLYTLSVNEVGGDPAPPSAYSRWLRHAILSGDFGMQSLRPTQKLVLTINVTKLFDIMAPGEYTLKVAANWHHPSPAPSYPGFASNSVAIRVVP